LTNLDEPTKTLMILHWIGKCNRNVSLLHSILLRVLPTPLVITIGNEHAVEFIPFHSCF
jgi:hypothetical protein